MRTWLLVTGVGGAELLDIARAAEDQGFYGIAMGDHVAMPAFDPASHPTGKAPFDDQSPFPDVFTSFAAMAAVTTSLCFVSYVYLVGLRHPLLVAKQVATASDLSGGRVALGIGAGWLEGEFERLGQPFARRGSRIDEMLQILDLAWSTGEVEFEGEHFSIPRSALMPRPRARIAVYVGGMSASAQRRAGRRDGWLCLRGDVATIGDALRRGSFAGTDDLADFRVFAAAGRGRPEEFAPLVEDGLTDLVVPLWWSTDDASPEERLAMIRDYSPGRSVPEPIG